MGKYRMKPVVVCAAQWRGDNLDAITTELGIRDEQVACSNPPGGMPVLTIHTLEGTMHAQPGDWIIRGIKGEFYPREAGGVMVVYRVKLTALRLTTEADERPSETLELEWAGNRDGLEGVWYTLRVWADTATHEHPAEKREGVMASPIEMDPRLFKILREVDPHALSWSVREARLCAEIQRLREKIATEHPAEPGDKEKTE